MRQSAGIKNIVEEMLKPIETEGYEVWNVEYAKEGANRQLRIYIDKEGGVNIDDCEYVSRYLSDRLDEDDPINDAYDLIVSSPGMDRTLLKAEHFMRYEGQAVEVALYKGYEGRKRFAALLGRKTEEGLFVTPIDTFTLEPVDAEICIPTELVSKVNLMVVL